MVNDTVAKTLWVAGVLSVICSAFVSISAVVLRPQQEKNKDLDRKKNILQAAGLYEKNQSIDELFKLFEMKVVNLESGEFADDIDPATFDQRKAARSSQLGVEISSSEDWAGIKRRSRYALVYIAKDEQARLQQLILPVHGKGLWSTLYGYLALDSDLSTIRGFAFYEHGETPGLGGEVDNPRWKQQWIGKQAFDDKGETKIKVLKGRVAAQSLERQYQVDGLAGATITSRGVSALLQYWLGENGFKPLLQRMRNKQKEKNNG